MEGMLTLREVMEYLQLEQEEVESLVRKGKIDAYKIGGSFLRFKKNQVEKFGKKLHEKKGSRSFAMWTRLRDIWVFNRVYVFSAILFALVVYILMQ